MIRNYVYFVVVRLWELFVCDIGVEITILMSAFMYFDCAVLAVQYNFLFKFLF